MANGVSSAFSPRVVPCAHVRLAQVKAAAEALITQMQFTRSYEALRLLHVQLQFLTLSDAWSACRALLDGTPTRPRLHLFLSIVAESGRVTKRVRDNLRQGIGLGFR